MNPLLPTRGVNAPRCFLYMCSPVSNSEHSRWEVQQVQLLIIVSGQWQKFSNRSISGKIFKRPVILLHEFFPCISNSVNPVGCLCIKILKPHKILKILKPHTATQSHFFVHLLLRWAYPLLRCHGYKRSQESIVMLKTIAESTTWRQNPKQIVFLFFS